MGDDHPISWCQNFEGGRSFYQGLGHVEAQFADAKFLQSMLKGIQWTAGQIQANCTTFSELSTLLASYHTSGQISDSAYNSLNARLTSAQDAYNGGSEKSAISYLNQFVSVAQNQIKGDAADLAARDALVAKAGELISWLTGLDAQEVTVLAFTKQAGKKYPGTQTAGQAALESLGAQFGFEVDTTNDASRFTAANLDKYDVVIFLDTTGDVLNDAQQTAFENYVKGGGGFVGVGSAIETETDWAYFTNLLGTRASSQAPAGPGTIKVADKVHPASSGLPDRWTHTTG